MRSRIGVYICKCGSNISDCVDVEMAREEISGTEGVILVKTNMFACADSTQNEIIQDIRDRQLDAIVIASCSPKLHLSTFRNVAIRAGLNPYNYIQVNIREQCSWAHAHKNKEATEKAIRLIKGGITRAKMSEPLEPIEIPAQNRVIVVGAGIAGMRASLELANMGTTVFLIEKDHFVGGKTAQWRELFNNGIYGSELTRSLYIEIQNHPLITLYTGAHITSKSGSVGNLSVTIKINPRLVNETFDQKDLQKIIEVCPIRSDDSFTYGLTKKKALYINGSDAMPNVPAIDTELCNFCGECAKISSSIHLEQKAEKLEINAGAILLTSGSETYTPKKGEYGYDIFQNVVTLPRFKKLVELSAGELAYNGNKVENIAYIYCVGSRDKEGEHKNCSRYCCTAAVHSALVAKKKFESLNNYHFNKGIRTYGKQEILYQEAASQGDIFIQFKEDDPPEVSMKGNGVQIKVHDILSGGMELTLNPDLIVLVTSMIPSENRSLIEILKVPVGQNGFFNEIHPKLRPVETVIDGIYIAGTCQSPQNISETVNSALAASIKSHSLLNKNKIEIEPTLAKLNQNLCEWCSKCAEVCPFDAIGKQQLNGKAIAIINSTNCKGCGMCLPVCPENALQLVGFSDVEMETMIEAIVE